ncbi:3979_t:CDS:1, partial [Funneliformis geosporum]
MSSATITSTPYSAITSISNLTPDEKRKCLFDVNYILEIPMEDFDDN